jgi:hypothetical protein
MLFVRAAALVAALLVAAAAHADDPFYKNKRLSILINFAPAGRPTSKAACSPSMSPAISTGRPTS